MAIGIRHQPVRQEFGRALNERIRAFKKPPVARKRKVLPQVLAQPARAHIPERRQGVVIHGLRAAPEGGVVMQYPAAAVVHIARHFGAGHGGFADQPFERLKAFREVGHLDRPVVHLGVDVGGVGGGPGRDDLIVPDALQIQGLRAGPRSGDGEIAGELKIESGQRDIRAAREFRQALVGRQFSRLVRVAEPERNAVEEMAIIRNVPVPQRRETLLGCRDQIRRCPLGRVRVRAFVEAVIAGTGGKQQDRFGGAAHMQPILPDSDLASRHASLQAHLEKRSAPAHVLAVKDGIGMRQPLAIAVPHFRILPLLAAPFHPFQRPAQDETGSLAFQDELVRRLRLHLRSGVN